MVPSPLADSELKLRAADLDAQQPRLSHVDQRAPAPFKTASLAEKRR